MPQPMTLIDQIFGKLTVRYGRDFLGRWEGLDIAMVKADWAEELNGLSTASIVYGLDHIDAGKAPTVTQFRDACLRSPPPPRPALERPAASPERVAEAQAKMAALVRQLKSNIANYEAGEGADQ